MPIRVYYEVLNQKGTPALYSDNYAQRPAAGYAGRIFNSPDTGQIFYDTGTTWTLLADAGVGSGSLASVCANGNTTATGIQITAGGLSTNSLTSTNLTAGSVPFIGTGGLFSQDNNNLFWDDTNNYFGIGTNTPSTYLDVHGTNNVLIQINNTTTGDSKITFLQASAGKWRIGNLYSGGTNLFHIYNNTAASLSMQIDSSNAALFYGSLSANSFVSAGAGVLLTNGSVTTSAGKTGIGGLTAGLSIALASGFNQTLTFPTGVAYTYTYPAATGTLALTSDLSSYLPLSGGTLTGGLTINSTLYINPTNTSLTGLDVASNNISFRSDNLEGSKRQLALTMGSGTLIQFTAQGYGAARATDLAFYTSAVGGVNSSPAIYITGGNNIGINTGNPAAKFHIERNEATNSPTAIIRQIGAGGNGNQDIGLIVDIQAANDLDNIANFRYYDGSTYTSRFSVKRIGNVSIGINPYTWQSGWTWLDQGNSGAIACPNDGNYIITANGYYASGWKYKNNGYIGVIEFNSGGSGRVQVFTSNGSGSAGGSAALVSGPYVANAGISWTNGSSDERLKKNFETTQGLDELLNLNPIKYHFIWDNESDPKRLGFTAQNVQQVIPEMVTTNGNKADDGSDYLTITPDYLLPVIVKSIQQVNTRLINVEEALLTLQQNLN